MRIECHPYSLEKVLLHTNDDVLWNYYINNNSFLDRVFWKQKFIKEFGEKKGILLSSHSFSDLGGYYFYKKYHKYRGCLGYPIDNPKQLVRVINDIYYHPSHFNTMARMLSCNSVSIRIRLLNKSTRNQVHILIRQNGHYTIEGCRTQNEISVFVNLIECTEKLIKKTKHPHSYSNNCP